MTQGVYKIVNLVNDKFYVGSTVNFKTRFRQHRRLLRENRHHCKHLQAAWNSYGEVKFDFQIVEIVADIKELARIEDTYLIQHVGREYCYNSGYFADAPWRGAPKEAHPNFGRPKTEEHRKAISETLKAYYAEDYGNHPRVGKTHTEESKKKISENRKGKMGGENHYRYGTTLSEEVRKKIGDTQRGVPKAPRVVSEDGLAKIRASAAAGNYSHWKGKTHTDESKAKMGRAICCRLPSGEEKEFMTMRYAAKELGTHVPLLINACVTNNPIKCGKLAKWIFWYKDTGKPNGPDTR